MDLQNELFLEALDQVMIEVRRREGIGVLGEKLLHAAVKRYYDGDLSHHEVKIGRSVADLYDGEAITEIQTGPFTPLKKKIADFLAVAPLTVVHPIANIKTIIWIAPDGEFSSPVRSPKKADIFGAFSKIVSLLDYLNHPDFKIKLLLLDIEEYRMMHEKYGKKHSARYERIPKALVKEIVLDTPCDYAALLPDALPDEFTQSEFSKIAKVRGRALWATLKVMTHLCIFQKEKVGRGYRYIRKRF